MTREEEHQMFLAFERALRAVVKAGRGEHVRECDCPGCEAWLNARLALEIRDIFGEPEKRREKG